MALIQLTSSERRQMQQIVQHTRDAREPRRTQAMLKLHYGERIDQAAQRQSVGRSTRYGWVHRSYERRAELVVNRIRDRLVQAVGHPMLTGRDITRSRDGHRSASHRLPGPDLKGAFVCVRSAEGTPDTSERTNRAASPLGGGVPVHEGSLRVGSPLTSLPADNKGSNRACKGAN